MAADRIVWKEAAANIHSLSLSLLLLSNEHVFHFTSDRVSNFVYLYYYWFWKIIECHLILESMN